MKPTSTLNNAYSGLITKGLGLPASRSLITMHFGLFHIAVSKISGGGGARYTVSPPTSFNFKAPQQNPLYYSRRDSFKATRGIQITVNMKGKKWTKEFVVAENQGKHIIEIINIVNKLSNNITEMFTNIKVKIKTRK